MSTRKDRLEILNETSIEYVKQFRTEDGEQFENKDAAIIHATGIAFTKKLTAIRFTEAALLPGTTNFANQLTDAQLQAIVDLGNTAAVVLSYRKDQPIKDTTS